MLLLHSLKKILNVLAKQKKNNNNNHKKKIKTRPTHQIQYYNNI